MSPAPRSYSASHRGRPEAGPRPVKITASEAPSAGRCRSLKDLKPGDYNVQALINRYETFHRADGSVIKLAPDLGRGAALERRHPGNLYSKPVKLHVDPAKRPQRFTLVMDQEIPPIAPKADTEFVKHVSVKSEMLSKFWGRPVYIGAHVLAARRVRQAPGARTSR